MYCAYVCMYVSHSLYSIATTVMYDYILYRVYSRYISICGLCVVDYFMIMSDVRGGQITGQFIKSKPPPARVPSPSCICVNVLTYKLLAQQTILLPFYVCITYNFYVSIYVCITSSIICMYVFTTFTHLCMQYYMYIIYYTIM